MTETRKRAPDESQDAISPSAKKLKAPDGSPAPSPSPSSTAAKSNKASDAIARAKEIARQRKLAAAKAAAEKIEQRLGSNASSDQSDSSGTKRQVEAPAASSQEQSPAGPNGSNGSGIDMKKVMAEIAARRKRITEGMAAANVSIPASNASIPAPPPPRPPSDPPVRQRAPPRPPSPPKDKDSAFRATGGLNVGLHPALLGDVSYNSKPANKRKKQLLDLSGPSKQEIDPSQNPYVDPNMEVKPRGRNRRALEFNEHGKYIEQANAMRAAAKLEELKKRIQATSKVAGVGDEIDIADMALRRDPPPDAEWWDQGLLTNETYDDLDDAESLVNISNPDSLITLYIQHPVPISPPWAKNQPIIKPPHLTKKEFKRIRKTSRAEIHKDKQDRIRLGLDPAPPPKVKLSNLMNVLTTEAIKDPTMVEQRVRREVEERARQHELTNQERKLSAEERHAKLAAKLADDEARAIVTAVFRVSSLANAQHRYKVNVNARQLELKGVVLLNPKFNLVVAEGGSKAINKYKKLMMQRIAWTVNAPAMATAATGSGTPADSHGIANGKSDTPMTVSADEPSTDLTNNSCDLIWEGEVKQHVFRKWFTVTTETETEAREFLQKNHVENYWTLAKTWKKI